MGVKEQIRQIADRIVYMRETIDMSQQELADKIGMPADEYIACLLYTSRKERHKDYPCKRKFVGKVEFHCTCLLYTS